MTEALRVFRLAFSTILFCVGVALLIYSSRIYTDTLKNIRNSYRDKEIYQQYNGEDSSILSYAELVSTLCNGLDYDIVIDGSIIRKGVFMPDTIKYSNIRSINYKKSYEYDNSGNIQRIIYTGITG